MAGEIEARLKALDLVLPEAIARRSYVPFLHLNGQLFISGQLPLIDGKRCHRRQGRRRPRPRPGPGGGAALRPQHSGAGEGGAARSRPHRPVPAPQRLRQRRPGFADHPKVLNGASELIVEILGNKGRHTRIAVGCASLPLNAAVEIDAIFAID